MRLTRPQFAAVTVAVALVALAAPVAAQSVVDYARNAGHVDGISAVHATTSVSHRGGKLVATDNRGYLPDGIVKKVPRAVNSHRLGGRSSAAFAQQCGDGAVLGRAVVPADVASAYENVPGFATVLGGPPDTRTGTQCHLARAQAEHVGVGTYRVRLATVFEQDAACSADLPAIDAAALITVRSDSGAPLTATYRPICDSTINNVVVDEVHITSQAGAPTDATFAVELVAAGGVPLP